MRRVPAFLAFLILLLITIALGVFVQRRSLQATQTEKAGWCCMRAQKQCVVKENMRACRSGGGALFNWSREACQNACR